MSKIFFRPKFQSFLFLINNPSYAIASAGKNMEERIETSLHRETFGKKTKNFLSILKRIFGNFARSITQYIIKISLKLIYFIKLAIIETSNTRLQPICPKKVYLSKQPNTSNF